MDTQAPEKPEQLTSITITPASVVPSTAAKIFDGIAFETITAGQPVVIVPPTSAISNPGNTPTVRLANASTLYQVAGIALNGASPGQPVKIASSDPALQLATLAPPAVGDVVWLGPTAGSLTVTQADITTGMYVVVLGVGVAIGKINLNITGAGAPR